MIEVEITPKKPEISIDLSKGIKKQIEIEIGETHSGVEYPKYTGPAIVTPAAYIMQVLQTEKKSVMENIMVLPIPYFQTSNPQGGNTVYIGE